MGAITLRKEKLVVEDMELGTGTVVQTRGTMTQINGSLIPYDGTNSINDELDLKDTIVSVDAKIATREIAGGDNTTVFKALDGVDDDDVTTVAQLTVVSDGTYTKTETDTLLADKADADNTMLLDGSTPSPDYSVVSREVPANKGYVLDTVQNIGSGDMAKSVYDKNDNGRVDTADGIGIDTDDMGITPYTQFMRLSQGTLLDANTESNFGIFMGLDVINAPTSGLVGIEQMDMVQAVASLGIQATGGKAQRAFSFSTYKWYTRIYDAGSDTWSQWLAGADETDVAGLQTQIDDNVTAIGDNATDIGTNTTAIATNATNIATNVTDIATAQSTADGAVSVNGTQQTAIDLNTAKVTGADRIPKGDVALIDKVTQAEYDALPTPRPATTLYLIVG